MDHFPIFKGIILNGVSPGTALCSISLLFLYWLASALDEVWLFKGHGLNGVLSGLALIGESVQRRQGRIHLFFPPKSAVGKQRKKQRKNGQNKTSNTGNAHNLSPRKKYN
jgi:hypothetical protein